MNPSPARYQITDEQLDVVLERIAAGSTLEQAARELNLSRYSLMDALARRSPRYKSRWTKHRNDGAPRVKLHLSLEPVLFALLEERAARDRLTRTEIVNAALRAYLGME